MVDQPESAWNTGTALEPEQAGPPIKRPSAGWVYLATFVIIGLSFR